MIWNTVRGREGETTEAATKRRILLLLLEDLKPSLLERSARLAEGALWAHFENGGRPTVKSGFDPTRGQWRADLILQDCLKSQAERGVLKLVLTARDLYVPPLNFVFGLALKWQGIALVSWRRLTCEDPGLFSLRLSKEMVHEVGHLEGLEHCGEERCVMRFSNTLQEVDEKGLTFCPSCMKMLLEARKG